MPLPPLGTRNRPSGYVGVKAPMFSFTRLGGADPILGVEMASTGEVACFGADVHEAFLKALVSTNFKIPKKSIALTVPSDLLEEVVHHVWTLHALGYELYATAETQPFLAEKGSWESRTMDDGHVLSTHHINASCQYTTLRYPTSKPYPTNAPY